MAWGVLGQSTAKVQPTRTKIFVFIIHEFNLHELAGSDDGVAGFEVKEAVDGEVVDKVDFVGVVADGVGEPFEGVESGSGGLDVVIGFPVAEVLALAVGDGGLVVKLGVDKAFDFFEKFAVPLPVFMEGFELVGEGFGQLPDGGGTLFTGEGEERGLFFEEEG